MKRYTDDEVEAFLESAGKPKPDPQQVVNGTPFDMGDGTIPAGQRHSMMFKLLRSQKARTIGLEGALATCQIENKEKCKPPIDAKELDEYLRRVWDQDDSPEFKAKQLQRADTVAFARNKKGGLIHDDQENIRRALTQLGYSFAYDAFADVATIDYESKAGPVDDAAMQDAWLRVKSTFGLHPPLQFFEIVVNNFARQRSHHPVLDYLNGLPPWDGISRLDTWLTTYAGAADTEFTRTAGALVLTAAVRRVRTPGCKFDELLVLLGLQQGRGKSELLRALCPVAEWFTDNLVLGDDPKRVIENTRGIWIAEIGEMQGKHHEVERIKVYLSRSVDGPVRMAYGRLPVRAPRKFINVGSTNDQYFLKDPTGNRRFWPITTGALNPAQLRRDRDQLWAEAVVREAKGESIHLPEWLWPDAAAVQESHREKHPFEELLEDALPLEMRVIKVEATWQAVGLHDKAKWDSRSSKVITSVMLRHGFAGKKNIRIQLANGDSKVVLCWVKNMEQPGLEEDEVGQCRL